MQSGVVNLFEDYADDGPMWAGEGPREARATIRFTRQYFKPPVMMVSITLLDARTEFMIRYELIAENVTTSGCDVVFKTWEDSKYARAQVQWIAIGASTRDEYWVDY